MWPSLRETSRAAMEKLGLSGIVTPGEGGQMRITIGVNPTQFREGKLDLTKVNTMRALFAEKKENPRKNAPARLMLRA